MIELWRIAVRDHPGRPAPDQCHVLMVLPSRLDWRTGRGYASVAVLCADSGRSEATVRRALRWAQSPTAALLLRLRRGHRLGSGEAIASEWQLTMPVDNPVSLPVSGNGLRSSTGQRGRLYRSAGPSLPVSGDGLSETSSSETSSSPARASAADTIRAAVPDATDDEIEILTERIATEHSPRDLARYLTGYAPGHLAAAIADVRAERDRQARAAAAAAVDAARRDGAACQHGTPGGASPHPLTGDPLCPLCRHDLQAVS